MNWRKFVEDSCEYTTMVVLQSIPNDVRATCWETFVEARIKALEAYRNEFIESRRVVY